MKVVGAILIFVLTVICSVGLTLYFVQYNRYQLIFEEVLHETKRPSESEPGLVNVITDNRRVCLKFDRLTGKTWQLVDSFYFDPNIISEGHGFKELKEDYFIYSTTSRKAAQTIRPRKPTFEELHPKSKIYFEPIDPNASKETISTKELFNDVLVDKIWVKCNNPACKAEYQKSKKAYFKYVVEHVNPIEPTAPPMVCEKCGEQSVFRAQKCTNPDCGLVFLRGTVPNDFPDRCPECGRSETEENRKRSREAR